MDKSARRAAVAAYKERKPEWGVFAVRCLATGQAWVGESRHLDTQQNGLWFALRHGSSPYRRRPGRRRGRAASSSKRSNACPATRRRTAASIS